MSKLLSKALCIVALLMPALIFLDVVLKCHLSLDTVSLQDLSIPWLFLRLPVALFVMGLTHAICKDKTLSISGSFCLSVGSLLFTFLATFGLGIVIEFLTGGSANPDFGFLNFLKPAVEIWIIAGLIWPLSFYATLNSLNSISQIITICIFGLFTWLPAYSAAKIYKLFVHRTSSRQIEYVMKAESWQAPPCSISENQLSLEEPEQVSEEACEEPRPLKPFHALNTEAARTKAANRGLIVLFKERDKFDLYGRKKVYWALPPSFAAKLVRCRIDMKRADEFSVEERKVLENLAVKGWIKKLESDGVLYYYGLDRKTANILTKQILVKA